MQTWCTYRFQQHILSKAHCFLPVTECTFLADNGYDVKNIYNRVKELYDGECIILLNKRNTKNTKLLLVGVPVCEAGLAMNRDGRCYERNRIRQKYCCSHKYSGTCPIDHARFHNGKKHHGCVTWITIPDDLRLSIDRNSRYFKSCYSLRTECERYNSRFKNMGQEQIFRRKPEYPCPHQPMTAKPYL